MIKYSFKVKPNTKPRQTRSDKWNNRPCVVKYRQYKDELKLAVSKTNFNPEKDLLEYYHLTFTIPFPKSYSKKEKNKLRGKAHRITPDKDNLEKAFLDALLSNDCQVYDGRVTKLWGDEAEIKIEINQRR